MGTTSSSYFTFGWTSGHGKQQEQNGQQSELPQSVANSLPLLGPGCVYKVGCVDVHFRKRGIDKIDEDHSGLFARLFYPTAEDGHALDPDIASTADETMSGQQNGAKEYIPWRPEADYIEGLAKYRGMSARKVNFFLDWVVGDKRVPAFWQSSVAESEKKFPVVIFSHGISGTRFFYSTLCASIASHGFVVAALEHRDGSCCWTFELVKDEDGNSVRKPIEMIKLPHDEKEFEMRIGQVRKRAREMADMAMLFADLNEGNAGGSVDILNEADFDWGAFRAKLELGQMASVGHSFGGASALTACAIEKMFTCCIVMDAWLFPFEQKHYEEVDQPVLMLNASKWQWARNVKRLKHLQNKKTTNIMFTLKDIVHQTFSDFGFLRPGFVGKYFGLQGDMDPEKTGTTITELIVEFLRDPEGSAKIMRQIAQNAEFVLEGTDIPKEKLDEIDELAEREEEAGNEEDRGIAETGEVDADI